MKEVISTTPSSSSSNPLADSRAVLPTLLTAENIAKKTEELASIDALLGFNGQNDISRNDLAVKISLMKEEEQELLLKYLQYQIEFTNFKFADLCLSVLTTIPKFQGKPEVEFLRALSAYHQKNYSQADHYLNKALRADLDDSLRLKMEVLKKQVSQMEVIETEKDPLVKSQVASSMPLPAYMARLEITVNAVHQLLIENRHKEICRILKDDLALLSAIPIQGNQEQRLLGACIGIVYANSLTELDGVTSALSKISYIKFAKIGDSLEKLLKLDNSEIRNPIVQLIKQNALMILYATNCLGIKVYNDGVVNFNKSRFDEAHGIFSLESRMASLFYYSSPRYNQANFHLLANINNSDSLLAGTRVGESVDVLMRGVKVLNTNSVGEDLAMAFNLRIGTGYHAMYSHCLEAEKDLKRSPSIAKDPTRYFAEKHPILVPFFKGELRTYHDFEVVVEKIPDYMTFFKNNAFFAYNTVGKSVVSGKAEDFLRQSSWTTRMLQQNIQSFHEDRPPLHHSFNPLKLTLAS